MNSKSKGLKAFWRQVFLLASCGPLIKSKSLVLGFLVPCIAEMITYQPLTPVGTRRTQENTQEVTVSHPRTDRGVSVPYFLTRLMLITW